MANSNTQKSRHCLKFLSWNINHSRDRLEGAKVDIPEVQRLLDNHDIFALQETKGLINFSNYCCFNSNRTDSNSGGVCIGVHKSLRAGVSQVRIDSSEDIVIIKLKANFFDLDKDTNLMNVYDSPKYGSYKKRKKATQQDDMIKTVENLQEIIADIPINEDVILLGDFDARTGTLDDYLP
jgi:exonuclease III